MQSCITQKGLDTNQSVVVVCVVAGGHMTVSEAARKLGCSIDAIYKLIWAGKLAATRRGDNWDIEESAVNERLKVQRSKRSLARAS
jgi:excisionase family DNA binding protein